MVDDLISETFQCITCNHVLPLTEFYSDHRRRSGHFSECKGCLKTRSRRSSLKSFGITTEDYDRMLAKQEGSCAICGSPCSTGRRLAVDHDHNSGTVRGLLCMDCNTGLGKFCDDPTRLHRAAIYLQTPPNHAQ